MDNLNFFLLLLFLFALVMNVIAWTDYYRNHRHRTSHSEQK